MSSPDILTVCGSAFVAIFVLLTLLAALMRFLVFVFPAPLKEEKSDLAVYAAITTVYQQNYPNSRISEIKEEK
jgi:hypothetical protein